MTRSRHDEHVPHLLGPAALGLLTASERRELDRHLRLCAPCRDELADLSSVTTRMGRLPADAALDTGGSARRVESVLAAVGQARVAERRRGQRLQTVFAAAASVVVLTAGVVTAAALAEDAAPKVPLEAVTVSAATGVDATAGVVAHTWGVEIQLVAAGLGAGTPYRVQVVTARGRFVDAGAFLGTGQKTLTCNLNASVLRADATGFVVRDGSGKPVLTADL